ncbi:MAG: hypothetical protein RL030_712 [Pseudomonadota bacterium]
MSATPRDRFYLGMTLAMAAVVLVGFTPTLFGRAAFAVPKMAGYLYLHGLVVASWYALMVTQATLVGTGRVALHRKLGVAGLAYLVLIPLAGMGAQLALPDRFRAIGVDLTPLRPLVENIFWLNAFSVLQFIGFLGAALLLRRRSESHKRLMLFAGIAIILPAASRLSRWPVFGNAAPDLSQPSSTGNDVTIALAFLVLFIAAMIIHDFVKQRRMHRVTAIGTAILFGMGLVAPIIAKSEAGKAIVWAVS